MRLQADFKSRGFVMDIGEVARRSGMSASALRFYEEKGLIASVGRQGLRRRFDLAVLDQLALIALGQAAGFSLEEIRSMFSPAGQPSIDRGMLAAKADEMDAKIQAAGRQQGLAARRGVPRADPRRVPELPAPAESRGGKFERPATYRRRSPDTAMKGPPESATKRIQVFLTAPTSSTTTGTPSNSFGKSSRSTIRLTLTA